MTEGYTIADYLKILPSACRHAERDSEAVPERSRRSAERLRVLGSDLRSCVRNSTDGRI